MNENPYQILDDILNCFNAKTATNTDELINKLKERNIEIKPTIVYPALVKLLKEEYVYNLNGSKQSEIKNIHDAYVLSFSGLLLIEDGGYVKMIEDDVSENKKMKKIETDQYKYSRIVKNLTYWIAVGTLISAVYYLLQIYIYFYPKEN